MMWFFDLGLFPFCRFWMRAYWLLPIWALMEIDYGTTWRLTILRHWAHVGGFLFGGIAAVALRYSGLEHKVNKAIEEKVAWTPDPEITQAGDFMESGKLDEAAATLNNYLTTKPDSVEAWNLLRAVYWRASNIPAYREATGKLCDLHVRSRESEDSLARLRGFLERRRRKSATVSLARTLPRTRATTGFRTRSQRVREARCGLSFRAAVSYGAACCRPNLPQAIEPPAGCVRLYEAASASAVPHIDLEQDIESGIRKARIAITQVKAFSVGPSDAV